MVEEMQGFHDNQARAFAEQATTITALRDRVAEVERENAKLLADYIRGNRAITEVSQDLAARATAAEAAIARLRDEVIEECAKVMEGLDWFVRLSAVHVKGRSPAEYAAALRALKSNRDTHHETR